MFWKAYVLKFPKHPELLKSTNQSWRTIVPKTARADRGDTPRPGRPAGPGGRGPRLVSRPIVPGRRSRGPGELGITAVIAPGRGGTPHVSRVRPGSAQTPGEGRTDPNRSSKSPDFAHTAERWISLKKKNKPIFLFIALRKPGEGLHSFIDGCFRTSIHQYDH